MEYFNIETDRPINFPYKDHTQPIIDVNYSIKIFLYLCLLLTGQTSFLTLSFVSQGLKP